MGVRIGDCCKLYKQCKICEEYKHVIYFSTTGGKKARPNQRRSYCKDCKERKHERILSPEQTYSYDPSLLDPFKDITIRGRDANNRKYEGTVCYEKAKGLVLEGAAGIYHSTLIHHFYNRKSLRKFILERDQNTCHYCGRYGNTIDHKTPRSKDGLSTPENCVCACARCNFKKSDMSYEKYLAKLKNRRHHH